MAMAAAELLSLHVLGRPAPRPFLYTGLQVVMVIVSALSCPFCFALTRSLGLQAGLFHTTGNFSFPQITHLALSSLCTATVTGFRAMTT